MLQKSSEIRIQGSLFVLRGSIASARCAAWNGSQSFIFVSDTDQPDTFAPSSQRQPISWVHDSPHRGDVGVARFMKSGAEVDNFNFVDT